MRELRRDAQVCALHDIAILGAEPIEGELDLVTQLVAAEPHGDIVD